MSSRESDWQAYFDRLDETPQRRAGGFVLGMEDVREARSRRSVSSPPGPAASRSRTPRLGRVRNKLVLLEHLYEKELRP